MILMSFCLCVIFRFLKQQIKQMSVSPVEAFCALPRLYFEMVSIDSFFWFIELDGELNCLDLLKTSDLILRAVKVILAF